jgi:hypothetical protein
MSESYKKESRRDWFQSGAAENLTTAELSLGCFQRIADATELMAKRHQELMAQKERAEQSRDYWRDEHDHMGRKLIAMRGQITKLKKKLAAATSPNEGGNQA